MKEALACPGHPAMHGGLSINPLKFLGAPPPEAFLALRLKPHPEEVTTLTLTLTLILTLTLTLTLTLPLTLA